MPHVYRFDDVEIDLRGFRVLKAGKVVSLEPKALNVLVFLTENRGRLVEKRELIDAAWGEAFVTENVLTRVITQLRKALEDDAKGARYIETVPTRGYRFVADLTTEEAGDTQSGIPETTGVTMSSHVAAYVPPEHTRRHPRRHAIVGMTLIAVACLTTAIFWVVRKHASPESFQIAGSTQITASNGISFNPTFSPDGKEIAFSTDRGKGFEILRRQLLPGGKEFQLTSDGDQNMQPAWSPDGALIAYFSKTRGGIWLIPALGGTARRLTDFGSHPAWSRDSQLIAFQSSPFDDLSADAIAAFPTSTIWTIHSDGTGARQITHPDNPTDGHGAPSWSPDSKHITFVTEPEALYSIAADGGGLARLTNPSARFPGYRFFDPVYSPDGTSVFFGADVAGGLMEISGLFRVRVSRDTSVPVGEPVQVIDSNGANIRNLAFSPDGKKLTYAALNITSSLQSLPVSKSGEPAGEPVALTSNVGCRATEPTFSPNGLHIAFESCLGRTGMSPQIWMMNADGSDTHQLTLGPAPVVTPAWYPDGRHILFVSVTDGQLLSVDTETLQQKPITIMKQRIGMAGISPDGTQLAMSRLVDGVLNVWLMDLANGKFKQLTFEKEMGAFPAWSPDGKFIATEMQRGADNSIVILPSAGGAASQLTPYRGKQWLHSWSPDGDKILFAKQENGLIWNIWSVSRSTKIEKQLTHYTKSNAFVRYPAASPRGNQIVYEYTETTGNIWMLEFK